MKKFIFLFIIVLLNIWSVILCAESFSEMKQIGHSYKFEANINIIPVVPYDRFYFNSFVNNNIVYKKTIASNIPYPLINIMNTFNEKEVNTENERDSWLIISFIKDVVYCSNMQLVYNKAFNLLKKKFVGRKKIGSIKGYVTYYYRDFLKKFGINIFRTGLDYYRLILIYYYYTVPQDIDCIYLGYDGIYTFDNKYSSDIILDVDSFDLVKTDGCVRTNESGETMKSPIFEIFIPVTNFMYFVKDSIYSNNNLVGGNRL